MKSNEGITPLPLVIIGNNLSIITYDDKLSFLGPWLKLRERERERERDFFLLHSSIGG